MHSGRVQNMRIDFCVVLRQFAVEDGRRYTVQVNEIVAAVFKNKRRAIVAILTLIVAVGAIYAADMALRGKPFWNRSGLYAGRVVGFGSSTIGCVTLVDRQEVEVSKDALSLGVFLLMGRCGEVRNDLRFRVIEIKDPWIRVVLEGSSRTVLWAHRRDAWRKYNDDGTEE